MIDVNKIKNLPVDSRKKLVDFMEGLPSSVKNYIRMAIPEKYMDASFFNGPDRLIHKYCTIVKCLPKRVNIKKENNALCADYQGKYCNILSAIFDIERGLPPKIQYRLESILNSDCYNLDTLIKVEVAIGELLSDIQCDRDIPPDTIQKTGQLATWMMMLYKLPAYDFYTYLDINDDLRLGEEDYNHLAQIHDMIWFLTTSEPGLSACNDIGILIYIYFKQLGMEKHIEKYNLFDRFRKTMFFYNCSGVDIEEVYTRLIDCTNSQLSVSAAASMIINAKRFSELGQMQYQSFNVKADSINLNENNGFIFAFKNIKDYDPSFLEQLAIKLRGLNKEEILHYVDITPENFTWDISANDVGHIRCELRFNIGTIYDTLSKEMRYIMERDSDFYLLFKDMMNTQVVYGISVERYSKEYNLDNPRKLITIKESTSFSYDYIPEI